MRRNISLEEAQSLLLEHCPRTPKTYIDLCDALDRILFEDIIAQENIPPFNRSRYDGYAFRAQDTQNATSDTPATFKVVAEIPAGHFSPYRLKTGEAVKILTGAQIPEGADAVIPKEEVTINENLISIFRSYHSGDNIVPAGADITQGEIIAPQGTVITPPLMGLLAALGISKVPVFQRPKIAIICVGDELLDISRPPTPGKIRNSNCITLQGYVKSIGAVPIVIGTAQDRAEEVAPLIEQALIEADMILTSGGTMDGDYDVIEDAIKLVGAEILYWRIENKPGSALTAIKNGKVIMCLSGSPNAAMLNFLLLGIPYIKKMAGRFNYLNPQIQVQLKENYLKTSTRKGFIKGTLCYENGMTYLEATECQDKALIRSLIGCDTLAEVPQNSGPLPSGTKLNAFLIG